MSEIPIGSPPAPPGRHAAPSGWYPDPANATAERWWDGWQWSRTTRAREDIPRPYPPSPDSSGGYPAPPAPPPYPGYPPGPAALPPTYPAGKAVATADGVPLAGWWWRVLAVVVDALVVSTVAGLLSFSVLQRVAERVVAFLRQVMATGDPGTTPPQLLTTEESLLLTGVQLAVAFAYHLLFLRTKAATPGKLLTGLRVVPVDQGRHAGPLPWGTIVLRTVIWLGPAFNALLFPVRLVDALFPLWQPKRQALHDLAAKTQVVRIR